MSKGNQAIMREMMCTFMKDLWLLCLRSHYNDVQAALVTQPQSLHATTVPLPEAPTTPPHSKILHLAQPIGWLHSPGLSGFPTSKQGVSVEEKHHTRATIAALKHEKSLFIFDRLPTFNGRVYVLHKQTVRLGLRRQPTAVALVVSWITGCDGAVVKMAHTELHSDSVTVNRALSHFLTAQW